MDLRAPLERLREKFDRIISDLNDPKSVTNSSRLTELNREHSRLSPVIQQYQLYLKSLAERVELQAWLNGSDADLKHMAHEELQHLEERIHALESQLRLALLPLDPNEDRNIILEIRAGAGGDEASLFAGELLRMYTRYAETKRWKLEPLSISASERGGIKEVIVQISGEGVWKHLKFERGVHRVQRVPVTEASGRIHTSTATVAVLPEAEEVDLHIDPSDLRIDTYRASGAGGQHINKTESAIRITHNPTGFVVACQEERSQVKNREKAMKLLRSRLLEQMQEKQARETSQNRKSQVGTGDRSEKIRTYNFPQDRITDHRINANVHNLPGVMEGDLGPLIEKLIQDEQTRQLSELSEPEGPRT